MPQRRAMSSWHASTVKVAGHRNEYDFAEIINGHVHRGSHTDKKDVMDEQDRSHSVKAGRWWQIFLYGKERLKTNTIFQGIGSIANIMIACLDAYPQDFAAYRANKDAAKQRLRPHMRHLLAELQKPKIFPAFLEKALFDGGNAEYLSIYAGTASTPSHQKHFHIFHRTDVIEALQKDITLANSQARHQGQTPEQKVVFKSELQGKQIGEIEDRHDSPNHYREMKFRLDGKATFAILREFIISPDPTKARPRATTYGKAVRLFK